MWEKRSNKVPNQDLMIVTDSCYAGKWLKPVQDWFQGKTRDCSIGIWASCGPNEKSWEDRDAGTSFFTDVLCTQVTTTAGNPGFFNCAMNTIRNINIADETYNGTQKLQLEGGGWLRASSGAAPENEKAKK